MGAFVAVLKTYVLSSINYTLYKLYLFLVEFPSAWDIKVNTTLNTKDDEESDDESDEEVESEGHTHTDSPEDGQAGSHPEGRSEAYNEFLQFLQLGCYGSPAQGYPVIVIVLSTIPITVRHFISQSSFRSFNIPVRF